MESAKVYPLNRNQLERSPLMTAPTTASRPKLLDQVREAIRQDVTVSDLPKSTNFNISALCPDIPESMHKDCSIT
jgi:hypothetical protein